VRVRMQVWVSGRCRTAGCGTGATTENGGVEKAGVTTAEGSAVT